MNKTERATARPWKIGATMNYGKTNWSKMFIVHLSDGVAFDGCQVSDFDKERQQANAELIVRAVNSFDAMKSVLEQIIADYKAWESDSDIVSFGERMDANITDAELALELAKGGKA